MLGISIKYIKEEIVDCIECIKVKENSIKNWIKYNEDTKKQILVIEERQVVLEKELEILFHLKRG